MLPVKPQAKANASVVSCCASLRPFLPLTWQLRSSMDASRKLVGQDDSQRDIAVEGWSLCRLSNASSYSVKTGLQFLGGMLLFASVSSTQKPGGVDVTFRHVVQGVCCWASAPAARGFFLRQREAFFRSVRTHPNVEMSVLVVASCHC